MRYICSLYQLLDGNISLTLYRGQKRYTEILTAEQAMELSNKLQSFVKAQQVEPYYLLDGVKR